MITIDIFVTYTIRDKFLNYYLLEKLNRSLMKISRTTCYIDILYNFDNKYISNPQQNIENQLKRSSCVLAINTPKINLSPWARMELEIALKNHKPVLMVSFKSIMRILANDRPVFSHLSEMLYHSIFLSGKVLSLEDYEGRFSFKR